MGRVETRESAPRVAEDGPIGEPDRDEHERHRDRHCPDRGRRSALDQKEDVRRGYRAGSEDTPGDASGAEQGCEDRYLRRKPIKHALAHGLL